MNVVTNQKKVFKVPVTWTVVGNYYMHAHDQDEAFHLVSIQNMPLPDNGVYLDDSFEILMDEIEEVQ